MNAELLYTSAPQGLKQGSRGFCTVLSTVGMPLNIATKLESLSGYRHLYPSGTPDAAKNPVNHSHLRLSVGGRTLSILSRISDYGLDYSQRTNKLAHHIVVDTPMPPCGPAALLADPSIMRSEWDGTCANIPTPPAFPALSVEPSPCTLWESITGDAGWAGVVASAWMNTTSKPTFIVFSEDQSDQLLRMLEESISLLPPSKRWQATFGTYVTNLPPDVECKVRCVVAGSDEARMASARGVVINLTQPLDQPPPSEAVSAARDGNYIGGRPNGPPSIAIGGIEEIPKTVPEEESVKEKDELVDDSELQVQTASPGLPPSMRSEPVRSLESLENRPTRHKHHAQLLRIALIAATTIAVSLIAAAYYLTNNPYLNAIRVSEKDNSDVNAKVNQRVENEAQDIGSNDPTSAPGSREDGFQKQKNPIEQMAMELDTPPPLGNDDFVIRISNPMYHFKNQIAIRGQQLQSAIECKKENLTVSQKEYFDKVVRDATYEWITLSEKSKEEPIPDSKAADILIPKNIETNQLFLRVTYKKQSWISPQIPIIDPAKADDFRIKASNFVVNGKEIPIVLPGTTITASIETTNQSVDAQEYLKVILEDAHLSWHSTPINLELAKGSQYTVAQDNKHSEINAVLTMDQGRITVRSDSIPVITKLFGKITLDTTSGNNERLVVSIDEPSGVKKPYQVRLGRQRLIDYFLFDQLINESDTSSSALTIREFERNLSKYHSCRNKLGKDFDAVVRILKENKDVSVSKDFLTRFESLDLSSLEKTHESIQNGSFENTVESLRLITQLIFLLSDPKDYKHKIKERCKPSNLKDENAVKVAEENEQRELKFVEWYIESVMNNRKNAVVSQGCVAMLQTFNDLAESMRRLSQDLRVLIEKPKFGLNLLRQNDNGDPIRITESFLPIELQSTIFGDAKVDGVQASANSRPTGNKSPRGDTNDTKQETVDISVDD